MRTLVAAIGLCSICALLTACGGSVISHRPPSIEPSLEQHDIVMIRMYESASAGMWKHVFKDVECHYREASGTSFESIPMDEVSSSPEGVIYHANVPGTSSGTTEYYFTWIDSSNTSRRLPANTNYPHEWYKSVELNRQLAKANSRGMQPATPPVPPPPEPSPE